MKQPQTKKNPNQGKQYKVKQLFGSFRTCYVIETKNKKSLSTGDTKCTVDNKLYVEDDLKKSTYKQTLTKKESKKTKTIGNVLP